jgi:hypothetical protein
MKIKPGMQSQFGVFNRHYDVNRFGTRNITCRRCSRIGSLFLAVLLAFGMVVLVLQSASAMRSTFTAETSTGPLLKMRSGSFDPLQSEPRLAARELTRSLSPDRAGLRMVQFPGTIQDAWYLGMLDAGLQVVSYLPDYGYLVWGSETEIGRLAEQAPLRWQGVFQPLDALHPDLASAAVEGTRKEEPGTGKSGGQIQEVDVIVQVWRFPQAERTVKQILEASTTVLRPPRASGPSAAFQNLGVRIAVDRLVWLAGLEGVVDVEPLPRYEKTDEIQGQIMAANLNGDGSQPRSPGYLAWLLSHGFSSAPSDYPIVDVTDDGIDNGSQTPLHADFYVLGNKANSDRLVYNANWTTDLTADGGAGHGNINASIALGYNDSDGSPYQDSLGYQLGLGINPFGRLAGSKIFNNQGNWDLSGDDFSALVGQSYALGSRISSNSWGSRPSDAYTADDQEYDALVRDAQSTQAGNQEMTIIFSAGNSGSDPLSTGSPGNAKNVISVGASESYRPGWTDGCYISPDQADNAQDIAEFSSRGPTTDGRTKPDLVAPGTHIQGAASQASTYDGSGVCDRYMPAGQTLYAASSGTSHSAPAVSGAASLIYNYYQRSFGGKPPSPAMIKAYLINSARYLTGIDASDILPSPNQGFGMVNLGMAFDGIPRVVVDQSQVFHSTGEIRSFEGRIAAPGQPFRVTLVWTDAPGATSGASYVNDLDLEVEVGGTVYKGNVFSGAFSHMGGDADAVNNVESVFLPSGLSGVFTVSVRATNLAGDGLPGNSDPTDQDFALVVYNGMTILGYLNGTVNDGSTGLGLADASVQMRAGGAYMVTTEANGYFTRALPATTFTVSAWKYGYSLQTKAGVVISEQVVATENFTITPVPQHHLAGCITDQDTGQGLQANLEVWGPFGDLVTSTTTTQVNNCFSLDLFSGKYTLQVVSRLHEAASTSFNLDDDKTQNFSLPATTLDGMLYGKVTEMSTGIPISTAQIMAQSGSNLGGHSVNVASDGTYELMLPAGAYTVEVSAPFYSLLRERVVISQSNLLQRDFALGVARLSWSPAGPIRAEVEKGEIYSVPLRLSNQGSVELVFKAYEAYGIQPGGVDAFGYSWTSSQADGGTFYDWLDATIWNTFTLDDDGETNLNLPFPFTFYRQSFSNIRIGNNGAVLFGNTEAEIPYSNTLLSATSLAYTAAPFWDDIDNKTGSLAHQTFGQSPNRMFVLEWFNRPHYNGIGNATFEMVLYEGSNNLKFQYADILFDDPDFDYGASATIGIRRDNLAYLQYSAFEPALKNKQAICFQAPGSLPCDRVDIPWMSLSASQGSLAPGESMTLTLNLDAAQVPVEGLYYAAVRLVSNDPQAQPFVEFPVLMAVGEPHLIYLPLVTR